MSNYIEPLVAQSCHFIFITYFKLLVEFIKLMEIVSFKIIQFIDYEYKIFHNLKDKVCYLCLVNLALNKVQIHHA